MDVIYIIALLLFLVLVYILIISVRSLMRLKKELKKLKEEGDTPWIHPDPCKKGSVNPLSTFRELKHSKPLSVKKSFFGEDLLICQYNY